MWFFDTYKLTPDNGNIRFSSPCKKLLNAMQIVCLGFGGSFGFLVLLSIVGTPLDQTIKSMNSLVIWFCLWAMIFLIVGLFLKWLVNDINQKQFDEYIAKEWERQRDKAHLRDLTQNADILSKLGKIVCLYIDSYTNHEPVIEKGPNEAFIGNGIGGFGPKRGAYIYPMPFNAWNELTGRQVLVDSVLGSDFASGLTSSTFDLLPPNTGSLFVAHRNKKDQLEVCIVSKKDGDIWDTGFLSPDNNCWYNTGTKYLSNDNDCATVNFGVLIEGVIAGLNILSFIKKRKAESSDTEKGENGKSSATTKPKDKDKE